MVVEFLDGSENGETHLFQQAYSLVDLNLVRHRQE